jgi:hypothetical protein
LRAQLAPKGASHDPRDDAQSRRLSDVAWGVLAATALIGGLCMARMGLGVTTFEIGLASAAALRLTSSVISTRSGARIGASPRLRMSAPIC